MDAPKPSLRAYLQLHFLVVIWSFTAILGRLISLSAVEIVIYRTLIASVGMAFFLRWKGIGFKIETRALFLMLGTGALISLHWTTFFLAARLTNISICLAGLATTSLWTSVIEPAVKRTKIQWYEPLLGLISLAGISVIFNTVFDQYLGLLVGILSALLAASFIVINGQLVRRHHHHVITFYEMFGAFLVATVLLPVYSIYVSYEPINLVLGWNDAILLLLLGSVCTVFAHSQGVKLMKQLSAFTVNLTINLEPVYGTILAVLFFATEERMPASFYLGAGLVLLSVLAYPAIRRYYHQRYSKTDLFR